MKLYFEMYSGISGDMTIGALLDLGASREKLEEGIKSLGIDGYELVFEKLKKNGIDAYNFDTKIQEGHVHRHLSDIYEIIDRGSFNDNVKNKAKKIFDIIADSEAKAHAVDKREIHFHEVGAMDSIIDIVGVSILLDDLNVENVYFSDLYDGTGYQACAHGSMPVPVPAVLNIIQQYNLPLSIIDEQGEHITPTGAAIVASLYKDKISSFKIKKVGIGAGNKNFEKSTNILRVMEIETEKK